MRKILAAFMATFLLASSVYAKELSSSPNEFSGTPTFNRGLRLKPLMNAQRPSRPLDGELIFNKETNQFEGFFDDAWQPVGGASGITTVVGTANQIDVDNTDPANPVLTLPTTLIFPGTINPVDDASVGLTVKGAVGQTAPLQVWTDSDDSTLALVGADGKGSFTDLQLLGRNITWDEGSSPYHLTLNGTSSVILPSGTSIQDVSSTPGGVRFNTDQGLFTGLIDHSIYGSGPSAFALISQGSDNTYHKGALHLPFGPTADRPVSTFSGDFRYNTNIAVLELKDEFGVWNYAPLLDPTGIASGDVVAWNGSRYVNQSLSSVPLALTAHTGAGTASFGLNTVDAGGGGFTLDLPTASGNTGKTITIKNIGASNSVIVDPDGGETIDGAATYTLDTQWQAVTIFSDGSNWLIKS